LIKHTIKKELKEIFEDIDETFPSLHLACAGIPVS
jgi:hypothetical protein